MVNTHTPSLLLWLHKNKGAIEASAKRVIQEMKTTGLLRETISQLFIFERQPELDV